ncbi:MAG: IS110 family transposase, partial [Thermodesulfobacteriota bacterium]|nr:IS110 family transposase [Thermodesulfobacteriota bacterium]
RSQYNLSDPFGCIAKPQNRDGVEERFKDSSVQNMINTDLCVIEAYDPIIAKMERDIIKMAKHHDPVAHALLNNIPGKGSAPYLNP